MDGGAAGCTSRWRRTFSVGCAVLALAFGPVVTALAANPPEPTRHFELPAGDAAQVLQQFARATSIQLVYPARVVRGIRTNPVRGDFTPQAALAELLTGTPLVAEYDATTDAYVVYLKRLADPAPPPHSAPPADARSPDLPVQLPRVAVEQRPDYAVATQTSLPVGRTTPLYYHIVTREEIDQSGVANIAEFLTTVPGYSGEGPEALQSSADLTFLGGANVYVGAYLKLRGWDSQHTAVLLNGRRLPSSPESHGPDLSRVPLAAVERIEVLPFAGSALYGDGAVGGAVDIILRKDVIGRSLTVQLGDSTHGGGREASATWIQGWGAKNGRTRLTLIGDFEHRGILRLGERPFLQRAIAVRPAGRFLTDTNVGPNLRPVLQAFLIGYPGVFTVASSSVDLGIPGRPGAQFAVVPSGQNANSLVPASFTNTDPTALVGRRQDRVVLRPPVTAFNVGLQIEHTLVPDHLELYGEIGYNRADERFSAPDSIEPLSLDLTDPRSPFRLGAGGTFPGRSVVYYFDPVDLPDARLSQSRSSVRGVFGLRGKSAHAWRWSLDNFLDLSTSRSAIDSYGASLNDFLRRWTFLNANSFTTLYDPLADHRLNPVSAANRDRFFFRHSQLTYDSTMFGSELRFGGIVAHLPSGALRLELGADYEWRNHVTQQSGTASAELYARLNAPATYTMITQQRDNVDRGQRIGAVAEAVVPLVRERKPLPLHAAELDLATRVARTDGGHAAISSLVALKVAPTRSWALRGTFSQGHVTPSSSLLNGPVTETNTLVSVVDPARGGVQQTYPLTLVQGGSSALRPETSQARVVGLLVTPISVPGLFLSVDGWSIRMKDRLRAPTAQELVSYTDYFPGKLERDAPLPWEQALGWLGSISRLDLRPIHVTHLRASGVDFAFRYRMPATRFGTFTLNGQLETVQAYEEQFLPITAPIDKINVVANSTSSGLMESAVVSPRGRATIGWQRQGWFGSLTATYSPPYRTDTTTPSIAIPTATGLDGEFIGSSTLWNAQLGYAFPRHSHGWLGDSTWTLGVRNLFDRVPPLRSDGTSFYSRFDDPRMRFIYVRVQWRR